MLGNGNNRKNNIINRRQMPYQEINELEKMNTPEPKYYSNANNNLIQNNMNNNSMNKQNIRRNMNINNNQIKNNMINVNNMNINNRKMNININQNHNINHLIQNNNINKALMVLRNEFRKKDDRIKSLELKVAELENKINILTKSGNFGSNININNNPNSNFINITQKKVGKNFTFAEKYSGDVNPVYNRRDSNLNKTPEVNFNRGNNPFRNEDNQNMNNKFYNQTKSANQYKIKANNESGFMIQNKNNNLNANINDAQIDGSIFTGNSSNFQRHSKNEVKIYLKEVKSKVDPIIFKEFIHNIKLLTKKENNNNIEKSKVIERVRILFGEQFKDLFIKFESILGFTNN